MHYGARWIKRDIVTDSTLDIKPRPASSALPTTGPSITCVVVTYGRRLHLLKQTVAAAQASPSVIRVIVVDNGCYVPVTKSDFVPRPSVEVIRLATNLGSAGGFHVGIAAAQQLEDTSFVMLLDDDNVGEPGFLERLVALHDALGASNAVGLCALRRNRGIYPTLLVKPDTVAIRANSFMNFHVASLPAKIWHRIRPPAAVSRTETDIFHLRYIETAPYGGLMLPIAAVKKIAPPDKDFVLYSDDHDYSLRLLDAGIRLYLTDVACINDAEESWDRSSGSAASALVSTTSPSWRIYYACRNRMLIEKRYINVPLIYHINRLTYLGILAIEALLIHRSFKGVRTALRPLLRGIADGEKRRLGVVADYPLPSSTPAATFPKVGT